jgi:hypothetical protein
MNGNTKRFAAGFGATMVVAAFLNVLPRILQRLRPINDGFDCLGFPFTFRAEGGFVWRCDFSYLALLADITIALAVAVGIGYACVKPRGKVQP